MADQLSAPKTPQDAVSVISMPIQMSNLMESIEGDTASAVLHPLSPQQENATEAIVIINYFNIWNILLIASLLPEFKIFH